MLKSELRLFSRATCTSLSHAKLVAPDKDAATGDSVA
jgi:hypothetical protein